MKIQLGMMLIFLVMVIFLISCDSLPFDYSQSQSWYLNGNALGDENQKIKGNIKLLGVLVDKPGGWDSIEKEFESLAPLYFWKYGYRFVNDIESADYAADISVREREYISGWRTKRSLAVEVRIWELSEKTQVDSYDLRSFSQNLPLAAGRVVSIGSKSFSSSETVGRMLSKAVGKSLKGLQTVEGRG